MNNARRKAIAEAVALLEGIDLEAIKEALDTLKSDEREAFDNMPEGLQQSDRGQASEAAADALDEAHDAVERAIDELNEAHAALERAAE